MKNRVVNPYTILDHVMLPFTTHHFFSSILPVNLFIQVVRSGFKCVTLVGRMEA